MRHLALLVVVLILQCTDILAGILAKGAKPGELYIYGPGPEFDWRLYYSNDYGQTVVVKNESIGGQLSGDATDGGLFVVVEDGLYFSSDYGASFVRKNTLTALISSGTTPGEVYALRACHVYRSTDYGATFREVGYLIANRGIAVGAEPGEVYVMENPGQIYYSSDYGTHFVRKDSLGIESFWISGGPVAGEVYVLATDGQLYFSSEYGANFAKKYKFPSEVALYFAGMVAGRNSGEVFVYQYYTYMTGGGEIYIYYSSDYGETFVRYHPFSTSGVNDQIKGQVPVEFKLFQNYPNPFNSETWISYTLPGREKATLTIFNTNGQVVRRFDCGMGTYGVQKVKWDGKDQGGATLPSGIYFYRLKAGVINKTRKAILLK